METKCPICGAPLNEGECGYCGYTDRMAVQKSENVKPDFNQIETGQEQQFSNNSSDLNSMEITPGVSRKSKTVALLLAIFLGGLGAHRFYVGKVGTGILYLLTVGLFGFGWIVDIILIATGLFRDEFSLPLRQ